MLSLSSRTASSQSGASAALNVCKLNCRELVADAGVGATIKAAFCSDACSCFADRSVDANGKLVSARPTEHREVMNHCKREAGMRLGWSPTPQAPESPGVSADAANEPSAHGNEPATRDSGERACNRGCLENAGATSGTQETARANCQKYCACLLDASFDAQGNPRPLKVPFESLVETCRSKLGAAPN